MEYYSILNINKIMKFAAKYMKFERLIFNEAIQTLKNKYFKFSLICGC